MVNFFKWDDSNRIDGGQLDEEHRRLFELANAAFSAADPADVKATVLALFKYMECHFANEERFMRSVDFEECDRHANAFLAKSPSRLPAARRRGHGDWAPLTSPRSTAIRRTSASFALSRSGKWP
jgi:hypothetical protein